MLSYRVWLTSLNMMIFSSTHFPGQIHHCVHTLYFLFIHLVLGIYDLATVIMAVPVFLLYAMLDAWACVQLLLFCVWAF